MTSPYNNPMWEAAPKKTDPDYEGSIWQRLGFDATLCPVCDAHLSGGICLNGCHLAPETHINLHNLMLPSINLEAAVKAIHKEG